MAEAERERKRETTQSNQEFNGLLLLGSKLISVVILPGGLLAAVSVWVDISNEPMIFKREQTWEKLYRF